MKRREYKVGMPSSLRKEFINDSVLQGPPPVRGSVGWNLLAKDMPSDSSSQMTYPYVEGAVKGGYEALITRSPPSLHILCQRTLCSYTCCNSVKCIPFVFCATCSDPVACSLKLCSPDGAQPLNHIDSVVQVYFFHCFDQSVSALVSLSCRLHVF